MKIEFKKEIANSITHGVPLVAFVTLLPFLFVKASHYELNYRLIGIILFAIGIVAVYMSSTLYHAIQHERTKYILRVFDHISIYYLIAGSYSALMLMHLPLNNCFNFLIILWALVILGTFKKIFLTGKYDFISTLLYVGLGCMGLLLSKQMFQYMPTHVLWLVCIGGACYLFGVIFYAWKGFTYHHAIWHVFVFAGSMCHFFAVYFGFMNELLIKNN